MSELCARAARARSSLQMSGGTTGLSKPKAVGAERASLARTSSAYSSLVALLRCRAAGSRRASSSRVPRDRACARRAPPPSTCDPACRPPSHPRSTPEQEPCCRSNGSAIGVRAEPKRDLDGSRLVGEQRRTAADGKNRPGRQALRRTRRRSGVAMRARAARQAQRQSLRAVARRTIGRQQAADNFLPRPSTVARVPRGETRPKTKTGERARSSLPRLAATSRVVSWRTVRSPSARPRRSRRRSRPSTDRVSRDRPGSSAPRLASRDEKRTTQLLSLARVKLSDVVALNLPR